MPDKSSDASLVERIRSGDTEAFAALYRAHVRDVYRVVHQIIRDADMVADIVQEAFVRALEGLPKLRETERFLPWLLAIARHTAVDERRYEVRLATLEPETVSLVRDTGPGPDEMAELSELGDIVRGVVAGLSARDATVVALVTKLDLSPAEVGRALGVTTGAAKVILHRARRRLRNALALELMVRRSAPRCPDFDELFEAGKLVPAARHLEHCSLCARLVNQEVQLYHAEPVMNHASSGSNPKGGP